MGKYSNIFGLRKYRAHLILEEFCNRYYDNNIYNILVSWEKSIKTYVNNELESFIEIYKRKNCIHRLNISDLAEEFVGHFFNTIIEPNGKMKWPDYIIDIDNYKNIHIDAKCVAYISRNNGDNPLVKYNNGCGQAYEIAKHILTFYKGKDDPFYLSFVIFMYYNENGYIEDTLFMPIIYAIQLRKFDWNNLDLFNFNTKGAKNSNVTLSIPSFLKKNGMMTLDEKELAIATAAYNYIQKHPEEFND